MIILLIVLKKDTDKHFEDILEEAETELKKRIK
jgi:hypothetical protein